MLLCSVFVVAQGQDPLPAAQDVRMAIQVDGAQPNAVLDIEKMVGEEVCFTLTARDKNGNVIRSWKTSGNATTLTLRGSSANTDTSTQSWNDDPLGYSWATITFNGVELTKISANEWSIPASDFDDLGQARICLIHTKAEKGVTIEVTPIFAGLNQVTDPINFHEGAIRNFLVELTSSTMAGNQVFQMRPYEIVVSPRDRYLNVTTDTIKARFSARFPGEFDSHDPGLSNIFSGVVFIAGPTNYLLASRIIREVPDEKQWIVCYSDVDNSVSGRTVDYEVLSHAPVPFNLLLPVDHYVFGYVSAAATLDFTWDRPVPPDPYSNIQVSRFDPRRYSDDVLYTWTIVDSISLTHAVNIASNSVGTLPLLTLTHAQVSDLVKQLSGRGDTRYYQGVWYVSATDGLSNTLSSPPNKDPNLRPGHYISMDLITNAIHQSSIPQQFNLGQNYPNPFNPSTTIRFALPRAGKVILTVHDLLGSPVATLLSQQVEAGEHDVAFNATALPSGTYIYKIQYEGKTLTRRMTLMK
jgi:hypothetical protein